MAVLAGDVGGTKTLLQIAEFDRDRYRVVAQQRYENSAYANFSDIVHDFMTEARQPPVRAACFGIAGPVIATATGEHVKLTNLPWILDSARLAQDFAIPKVRLINDFQAAGYGMEALTPADLAVLQRGTPEPQGLRALIGAGTGLGQGLLLARDGRYEAHSTEGGHADFAPTDEIQIELLRYLRRAHPHVSYERVVSGRGLANIYEFLRDRCGDACTVAVDSEVDDRAAAIARAALTANDPLAAQALEIFVDVYGAQAGNLALTTLATGGVYIAGGIAPKILPRIVDGRFMRAFRNKGRMSALVATIPVYVVTNQDMGLMGTALAASRL